MRNRTPARVYSLPTIVNVEIVETWKADKSNKSSKELNTLNTELYYLETNCSYTLILVERHDAGHV